MHYAQAILFYFYSQIRFMVHLIQNSLIMSLVGEFIKLTRVMKSYCSLVIIIIFSLVFGLEEQH